MSEYQDLVEYAFAGDASTVEHRTVRLSGTAVPTSTAYPRGTFCVIDYPTDDSNHDVYFYGQATVDVDGWILVHNET